MVHARNRRAFTVTLALGLAACGHDGQDGHDDARDPDVLDAAVDAHASPSTDDSFDAASCDPLGLEQPLDPTPVNIASALDQHCFNSGAGRRALVFVALCAHDMACGVSHTKDCRAEYEAHWQEGLRPRGRSVPCADALLDSMSCLAQARCDDAHACDAASDRAKAACDPNAPILGAPMCPPLPEDRELTKGPIPEDAINDAGMLDESRVPDFIPALDQSGEIAGYVRYCAIHAGGAIPVYADDLKTVLGHMIPGRGFVPGALP
jgi:hypothetical protein